MSWQLGTTICQDAAMWSINLPSCMSMGSHEEANIAQVRVPIYPSCSLHTSVDAEIQKLLSCLTICNLWCRVLQYVGQKNQNELGDTAATSAK